MTERGGGEQPRPFDIDGYLQYRDGAADFIVVELGHGPFPVAERQHNLTGGRAYVGVETWQERGIERELYFQDVEEVTRRYGDSNVFFLNQEATSPDDKALDDVFGNTYDTYEPTSILPDGAGDEVILSNVFGAAGVGEHPDRTRALFEEVMRLADEDGKIVIRETIEPYNAAALEELLATEGIPVDARVTPEDAEQWAKLEAAFGNEGQFGSIHPDSFYLILSKPSAA